MSSRQQQTQDTESIEISYTQASPQEPPHPHHSLTPKRIKIKILEPESNVDQQSSFIMKQHLQLLNCFQKNISILTPTQKHILGELKNQQKCMQQEFIQEKSVGILPQLIKTPSSPNLNCSIQPHIVRHSTSPVDSCVSQDLSTTFIKSEEPSQPLVTPLPQCDNEISMSLFDNTADLDESEVVQHLLAQEELANAVAESLFKHLSTNVEEELQGHLEENNDIEEEDSPLYEIESSLFQCKYPNSIYNVNMNAKHILELCKEEGMNGEISNSLIADDVPPLFPPNPPAVMLSNQKLIPTNPFVYIEDKRDGFSTELHELCLKRPITVVRNLAAAFKLDLKLFSTQTLLEISPDHSVEVRTQIPQKPDENLDPISGKNVWKFISHRSRMTIAKFAQYQVATFNERSKGDHDESSGSTHNLSDSDNSNNFAKRKSKTNYSPSGTSKGSSYSSLKTIKFGTNIDLSDNQKFKSQLHELTKLPPFLRVESPSNMLSHVGHTILGMNTVQLYMKVPGSRTPGHQENNNFCSVNINIGPDDCQWFAVPEPYWGAVYALCKENQISYHDDPWWPVLEDLHKANIPLHKFIQKVGDLVWVNVGCVHWVQALGWCNNIAWNVGPLTASQYKLAIERYEWNKVHNSQSIVPMLNLSWNLAKNIKVTNYDFFEAIKHCLLRNLRQCFLTLEFVKHKGVEVKFHGRTENEISHYCGHCEIEVFNLLFIRDRKNVVYCFHCAKKQSANLKGFVCLEQYRIEELMEVYDNFKLCNLKESN